MTLRSELSYILYSQSTEVNTKYDLDMQHRVRVDDVYVAKNEGAAYIHVSADGDELEKRQVFVWLQKNKGKISHALAQRYGPTKNSPKHLWFVESKFDEWDQKWRTARKYPELNLPDPYSYDPDWVPDIMQKDKLFKNTLKYQERKSLQRRKQQGVGDANQPFPRWGYAQ